MYALALALPLIHCVCCIVIVMCLVVLCCIFAMLGPVETARGGGGGGGDYSIMQGSYLVVKYYSLHNVVTVF